MSSEPEAITLVLWLGIIRDLRTALKDSPLPVEVLRDLLAKVA
jgi:hypothetical protein